MDINTVKNIVNFIIDVELPELQTITKERFNDLAQKANVKLFKDYYDDKKFDELRIFKVVRGDENNTPLNIDQYGKADLPSNYFRRISLTHKYKDGTTVKEVPVAILDDTAFDYSKKDPIEIPIKKYPVANFQSDEIRFLPVNLRFANFSYYRYPNTPVFATTWTKGFEQYSAGDSTDFEWNDDQLNEIIILMLADLGIAVDFEQLSQYIQAYQANEQMT